ncbi:F0F1 ATP synthase subunit epsilon [Granulosicoccus sp. 3-233]|uniref:F0F1 ATP synthase subunit epsilon n=1 Tax=Granulosicoccus sp. 3-233 TaxID=3417969 RepID=UPI003D34D72C
MASSLRVEIVSAENEIWSGEASMVSASAQMGEVGIAPGHAPFITRIKPGEVRVKPLDNSEELDIYVSGGILEVQPHIVTIMADTALRVEELDEASAQKAKDEAEAALAGGTPGEIDFKAVQAQLAEASAQLQLIKKLRR